MNNIANNILAIRNKLQLNQKEYADKLGIGEKTVYNYETGKTIPDIEIAGKIAKLGNISLDSLLSGDEMWQKPPNHAYKQIEELTPKIEAPQSEYNNDDPIAREFIIEFRKLKREDQRKLAMKLMGDLDDFIRKKEETQNPKYYQGGMEETSLKTG